MPGIFILSLDTEIGWGPSASNYFERYAKIFDDYRHFFPRLVALLDQYEIPTTWATVGHLFLGDDEAVPDVREPELDPQAEKVQARADSRYKHWFRGKDIIDMIMNARTPHEIGTHTFSHVFADDPQVSAEVWDSQMRACAEIHARFGLGMKSIVYPQNRVAYLETLHEYGITSYRGLEDSWHYQQKKRKQLPTIVPRVGHVLDQAMAMTPPTYPLSTLKVSDKLVNLPASQFLIDYGSFRSKIPTESRIRKARLGMERAAERDALYHIWLHPHNMGTSERMFEAMDGILKEAAQQRERGAIQVLTMEQAADLVLNGA